MEPVWPADGEGLAHCAFSNGMPPVGTDGGSDERISVAATDRIAQVPGISVQGSGSDDVGRIALTDGVGSVDFNCTRLQAALYTSAEYDEGKVFYGLAASTERWYPFRLNCKDNGNLDSICYAGTDGTGSTCAWTDGRCLGAGDWIESRVRFPRFDMPPPRLITGYTIDGPSISLPSGGAGTITLDGAMHELFAFGDIDCSEDCGPPGWHKLDVLTWDPVDRLAGLAMLFLLEDPGEPVQMDGRLGFPGFRHLELREFPATFTTP